MSPYNRTEELVKELSNLVEAATVAAERFDWTTALRLTEQAKKVADELPKKKNEL